MLHARPDQTPHETEPSRDLYRPGDTVWRRSRAETFTMLIDAANYYRALHAAILKARKSVFILGWDIDSRIELLRGKDVQPGVPTRLFDLIVQQANAHPDMQFYLNRWDYTIYQAGQREGFSLLRWRLLAPPNVHFQLDGRHPVGACHHQKIVVVDDELAFCGGMDIALGRWDRRSHHAYNRYRKDPGGAYAPHTRQSFMPHHDIMTMLTGPVVRDLADLARTRWQAVTGKNPVPLADTTFPARPACWPDAVEAHTGPVDLALTRTMPPMPDEPGIYEIEKLLIDEIARAETFIYIENQYLTAPLIARALNRRLHAVPALRVLLVSCMEPQGIMERLAMWGGRVRFGDILREGLPDHGRDRVIMAFPAVRESHRQKPVRIHSKIMVVDDRILHIGSANLNNRSMRLDSECDLSFTAQDDATRQAIADRRNDLIREHTGMSLAEIDRTVAGHAPVENFLNFRSDSTQHLCRVDDEQYRLQRFIDLGIAVGDPSGPWFGARESDEASTGWHPMRLILLLAVIVAATLAWKFTPAAHYLSPTQIAPLLERLQSSGWAIPACIGIYIAATAVFFPLSVLVFATSIAFPPLTALVIAFFGMVCSACCGYALGRVANDRFLQFVAGKAADKISDGVRAGGILGVTLVRLVPMAPLGIVDLCLGMTKIPFGSYLIGTMLGMLPGVVMFTLLGHSISRLWHDRDMASMLRLGLGLAAWIGVVVASHMLGRRWKARRQSATA